MLYPRRIALCKAVGRRLFSVAVDGAHVPAKLLPLLLLPGGLALPAQTSAQQFVTDDAAIVDYRACQVEAWVGEAASWVLPACQPVSKLEVSAGLGLVREAGGSNPEYVLQGKLLLREGGPGRVGVGLVAGAGFGPLSQVAGDGVAGAFAYVPVSVSIGEDRLILHVNGGWHYERDEHEHNGVIHADAHHQATWAARADLLLPMLRERVTAIGEVFAEGRTRPEFQVGLRTVLLPGRLGFDVSWGGHTVSGFRGAGWALGFAWTPPPFF